jgi:hypothetical protein
MTTLGTTPVSVMYQAKFSLMLSRRVAVRHFCGFLAVSRCLTEAKFVGLLADWSHVVRGSLVMCVRTFVQGSCSGALGSPVVCVFLYVYVYRMGV